MTIRNPVEWGADSLSETVASLGDARRALARAPTAFDEGPITLRKVSFADLAASLREGFDDFVSLRTDVLAIGLIYPLAGLFIAQVAFNASLLPLLFPLVAGFALLGPFAAIGLYEASRRRERGESVRWSNVIDAFASPSASAIWTLGLMLTALYLVWLAVAWTIHRLAMGPGLPESLPAFAQAVFGTPAGWTMMAVGCAVGAGFAVAALGLSVISFPLLLDRNVTVSRAIDASVRLVRGNPATMLAWGAIVAGGLALGALPALLGLIVVMPVLGHATWRLYRKAAA